MKAHIELPYDRGHQWHLVVGSEKAVVSERAALVLIGRFGVTEASGQIRQESVAGTAESIGEDFRLSKKARKMLKSVGVEVPEDGATMKRHRWCLTMCLDCGLHRQTIPGQDGSVSRTEYKREVELNGAKGTLVMYKAGPCDRNPPLDPGEYVFRPKTLADHFIFAGIKP